MQQRAETPPPRQRERYEREAEPTAPAKEFREDWQGTRLFVENLNFDVTWMELKDHFKQVGSLYCNQPNVAIWVSINGGGA